MCPPAPQHTYIDQYSTHPDESIPNSTAIQADNIVKQENYEAEVLIYRALERLDEQILVMHSFKCSFYQFKMCNQDFDLANKNANNSYECDFLVIGKNYFVVIAVKNSMPDGDPVTAFKKSLDQRNRMRMLINGICQGGNIFLFTAFPSLRRDNLKELDNADTVTVICKDELDDFEEFKKWWTANVTTILRQNQTNDSSLGFHEKAKHIFLTIFCTELDIPDISTLSFSKIVLRIDKELKTGLITLQQKLKTKNSQVKQKKSINSGVVLAPEMIQDFVGVRHLTAEQNKVYTSKQNLLLIIGPAGSGKTVLLVGKMIQMAKSEPDKKVVVFKFAGRNNNCTLYQDACKKAGIEIKLLVIASVNIMTTGDMKFRLLPEDDLIPSVQLATNIANCKCSVVIVQLHDTAFNENHDLPSQSLFLNLFNESNVNVIIDDFQYNTASNIFGSSDLLVDYAHSNCVLMACDLPQFAACSMHIPFGANLPYFRNHKTLSQDNCVMLTKNLRNTRDISDVLSVIRSPFVDYAAAQRGNLAKILLPLQSAGHFIRGPLTNFHVFNHFKGKEIRDLVKNEIVHMCKYDDFDKSHVAIVYTNQNVVENILSDVDEEKITLCNVADCYSSEWPVVIVLFEAFSRRQTFIPAQLYLAISRARVKCTVFVYPNVGQALSEINFISTMLSELRPIAHIIHH